MFDHVSLQVADSWGNWSREREEREAKEAREEGGREVSWLLERRRKMQVEEGGEGAGLDVGEVVVLQVEDLQALLPVEQLPVQLGQRIVA